VVAASATQIHKFTIKSMDDISQAGQHVIMKNMATDMYVRTESWNGKFFALSAEAGASSLRISAVKGEGWTLQVIRPGAWFHESYLSIKGGVPKLLKTKHIFTPSKSGEEGWHLKSKDRYLHADRKNDVVLSTEESPTIWAFEILAPEKVAGTFDGFSMSFSKFYSGQDHPSFTKMFGPWSSTMIDSQVIQKCADLTNKKGEYTFNVHLSPRGWFCSMIESSDLKGYKQNPRVLRSYGYDFL